MNLSARISALGTAIGGDIKSIMATLATHKTLATKNLSDIVSSDTSNQLSIVSNQLYVNVSVGTWTTVPATYLPPDFAASGNTVKIRRTVGFWEMNIVCTANINSTSWAVASSGAAIPTAWLPDMDVQIILTGNSGQVGRLWIRQSGQVVYTGTALTSGYQPVGYIRVSTAKAMPTTSM